jgi:PAS domain S-box-containing protein
MDSGVRQDEVPPRPAQKLEARVRELEREVEALRAKNAKAKEYWSQLEAIIDSAPLAIYLKDAAHRYVLVNREYERLAARPRADILGHDDFELFPEPVAKLFRGQDLEIARSAASIEFKETVPLPDGVHSFLTSKFPLRSGAGELQGVAGVCTEITALEKAQLRLEQAQGDLVRAERLATLGELSAVIAHEVRNPLGVVFNSLATLRRTVPNDPQSQVLLGIIGEEADRLNRMVSALLELARPAEAQLAPTDVRALVASAVAAAQALAEPGPEVRVQVPCLEASLDEKMVRQALVNLVSNALQAPERKSPVTVRVERAGDELRFEVIDDGAGVAPELRERIFTPFFTTRAAGIGLGLAVVKRVADAHRGKVTVGGTPGGGATFTLRVPVGR